MEPLIHIHIDGAQLQIPHRRLTGSELLALVPPGAQAIWLDVPDAQDQPIQPGQSIDLEDGDRFFTDRARTIYLDKLAYQVRSAVITAGELRALPTPPLGPDHGIWKDIPDDLDDPIAEGELVRIHDGDRFFSKPLPHRELHIFVNGRRRSISSNVVSYEEIVLIAFPDGAPGANVIYSVVYSNAVSPKREGTLAAGSQVTVKEGSRFNVTPTDKS